MYKKYLFEVFNNMKDLKDGWSLEHEEIICRLETEYGVFEIRNFKDNNEEEPFCYPVFIYPDGTIEDSDDIIDDVYGCKNEQLEKVCNEYMDNMAKLLQTEHRFTLSEMECCYLMSIFNKYKRMNGGIEDVYKNVVNKIYTRQNEL